MIEEEKRYKEFFKKNIDLIKEIYKDKFGLENNYFELENIINKVENYMNKIDKAEQSKIERIFQEELKDLNEKCKLYILSFLAKFYKKTEYINKMFEIILNSKELNKDTKYFIFGQLNYIISTIQGSANEETILLQSKLYENILEEFNKEIDECSFIPKEERNENFVIIFTSQLLSVGHGPTKTTLDICYSLIKYLNKRIILINTNDFLSDKGIIPIHNTVVANTENVIDNICYEGITIPYCKTKNKKPDLKEYINIVNIVKKYKPYLLFSIGDKCVIGDICKQIVPSAAICLGGTIPVTKSDFVIPYTELLDGLNDKRIIKTKYNNYNMNYSEYFVQAYKEILSNTLFK